MYLQIAYRMLGSKKSLTKMKKYLSLLHGETPKTINLFLIYGIGFIAFIVLFWYYSQNTMLERVLIGAIGLDIVGGIIANLTASTKKWWQSQSKVIQYLFLIVHIIQPIAFGYLASVDLSIMLYLFMYVLVVGCVLINLEWELNRIFSITFTGLGIMLFAQAGLGLMNNWFIVAYLLKLVVGFCIKEQN